MDVTRNRTVAPKSHEWGRRPVVSAILCVVFLSSNLGCGSSGPRLVTASGKVTFQGKSIEGASVTFTPIEKGLLAQAVTDSGGRFSLATSGKPGATLGKYLVTITKSNGKLSFQPTPEDLIKAQKENENRTPQTESALPAKYASGKDSGLSFEITGDPAKDVFEINLADE